MLRYADESTVQSLLAQLAAAEHSAHRWGHDDAIRGLRGIVADALDDVGRGQEAQLLRTQGRHVLVTPEGVRPGRFSHHPAFGRAVDVLQHLSDLNAGDYPHPEFGVDRPGWFRPEDFEDEEGYRTAALPGHVRLVHEDPAGMEPHRHEDVPYPELPAALARVLEGHMNMFEPFEWADDPEEADRVLGGMMSELQTSPFEEEDPDYHYARTAYALPSEDWSRVRLNLGSTAGFDSDPSGPTGNGTYAPNPTVPVLPFPEQGEWDDQLPNDWTTRYHSGQPAPRPPVPQYPHEIYPDNRPRPQAPKPPPQHTQSLDPDGMPMSETPGAMGGGSFAPQQTRMQNPGGYNPRQHYPRLATGPIDSRPATTLQWGTGLLPPGDQSAHPDTPQHGIGDDEGYPEPAWDRYPRANPANPAGSPQMSDEDYYNHLIHKGLQDSGPIYDETQRRLYPQKSHQMGQEPHWSDEGGYHPSWHPEGGKAPNSRNEQNSPPGAWDWAKPWKFEDDEDPEMYGWDEDRAGFLNEVHQQPFEVTGHQAHADFLQDQLGEQHPDVTFRRHIGDLVDLRTSTPWEDKAGAVSGRGFPYDPSVRGFSPSNIPFHIVGTSSPDSASWLTRELRPGLGDDWDARTNPDDWVWRNWAQTYMGPGPFVEGTNGYQSHWNWLTGRGWNPEEDHYGFGASSLTPVELGAYDLENPENIDPAIWPQIEALLRSKWNRHQKFARGASPTHYADFPVRMLTGAAVLPRLRKRKKGGYEYEGDEDPEMYAEVPEEARIFTRLDPAQVGGMSGPFVRGWVPHHVGRGVWTWGADGSEPHDPERHGGWEHLPDDETFDPRMSNEWLWAIGQGGEPPSAPEQDWMHGQDVPPEFKYERTEYADDINTDDYYRRHSLDTNAMVVAADWNDDNSGDPWESQFLREADPWIRDRLQAGWKPPPVGSDGLITDRDYSFTSPILRWPETSTGWPLTAMHLQPRQHDAAHVPDEHEDPNGWWWGSAPDAKLVTDPGAFAEFAGLDPNSPELEWAIRAARNRQNGDYLRDLTPVEQAYGGITDLANVNPDEWAQIVNLMRQRKRELGRFEDDDDPTEYGPAPEERGFQSAIQANPIELTNHGAYADWLRDQERFDDADFRTAVADSFGRRLNWGPAEPLDAPAGFLDQTDTFGWDDPYQLHTWANQVHRGGRPVDGLWGRILQPQQRWAERGDSHQGWRWALSEQSQMTPDELAAHLRSGNGDYDWDYLQDAPPVRGPSYTHLRPEDRLVAGIDPLSQLEDDPRLRRHYPEFERLLRGRFDRKQRFEGDEEPIEYGFGAVPPRRGFDPQDVLARVAAGRYPPSPIHSPHSDIPIGTIWDEPYDPTQELQPGMIEPTWDVPTGYAALPRDGYGHISGVMQPVSDGAFLEGHFGPKQHMKHTAYRCGPNYAGGMDGTQHPLRYPPCHNPEEPLQYDPMDYGAAEDEAEFRRGIGADPLDHTQHLVFSDFLRDQGRDADADFQHKVGGSIQRRLGGGWSEPWTDRNGYLHQDPSYGPEDEYVHRILRPNRPESVDWFDLAPALSDPVTNTGDVMNSGYGQPPNNSWIWERRFTTEGARPLDTLPPYFGNGLSGGFVGDLPTLPEWHHERRARWGTANLHGGLGPHPHVLTPEEEWFAGIQDPANLDPRIWPQLEALLHERHEQGLRFEDGEESVDYELTPENRSAYFRAPTRTEYAMPNMNPFGHSFQVGEARFDPTVPRGVLADALQESGDEEGAGHLRSEYPVNPVGGRIETPSLNLADYLSVNGLSDEDEPWTVGDSEPLLEIDGADLIALASDGVVLWDNNRREWVELEPSRADRILDWNLRAKPDRAARLLAWMRHFYPENGAEQ